MSEYTPMMTHYLEIKEKYPDALVFYRLGDFYEMFFDDAKTASTELDLVLTGRNAGVEEKVPMCGVPFHAVNGYIQRLINKGYKVAIVEQLEDPSTAVGLVKRDVIKVVTPGTIMEELSEDAKSNYIASIVDYKYGYGLAICDITTGESRMINVSHDNVSVLQTIISNEVKEIVVKNNFDKNTLNFIINSYKVAVSNCEKSNIEEKYKPLLVNCNDTNLLDAIGLLLNYLEITQRRSMSQLLAFEAIDENKYLKMDYSTMTSLELITANKNNNKAITLYSFLDNCKTAMGSRLLKKWIIRPLRNIKEINDRLDFIEYLNKNFIEREQLKQLLSQVYDLQRIIARIGYGSVNPKDLLRLQKSLHVVPEVLTILKNSGVYPQYDDVDNCQDIYQLLESALVEDVPLLVRDGGVFKDGYNQQLDQYRLIQSQGKNWIASLEQTERERTQIKNLKIGYNRVFGYYIEITKSALPLIDPKWGYQRKQTLTTSERFITSELKEKEDLILHSQEKSIQLEQQLFCDLVDKVKSKMIELQKIAEVLSFVDALYSLTKVSSNYGYVRPQYNNEGKVEIKAGRHPILDSFKEIKYVANDLCMDNDNSTIIITGPNMGGKSTYMRQCVLLCIMAQMGCFIPAKSASLPMFDKIFTRIGANDDILSGQSTFMVEMIEANNALSNATKDSLIVFDEIGRGTSTYDGMALAQAILEYIDTKIMAKTLFSTHYHELTNLENNMEHIKNKHVVVNENNGEISFLYKVKDGKADKSYGIHVASLAKLPQAVIDRANILLVNLTNNKKVNNDQNQIIMLETVPSDLKQIKDLVSLADINNMTPLEALQFVVKLKEIIKEK